MGSYGAALHLLRSAQSLLQHGAGPVDHRLPQVACSGKTRGSSAPEISMNRGFCPTEGQDAGWRMSHLCFLCWTDRNAPWPWRQTRGRCCGSSPSTWGSASTVRKVCESSNQWHSHEDAALLQSAFSLAEDGDEVLQPFRVMSLYSGGTFDRNYNKRFEPVNFSVPALTKKVADLCLIPDKAPVWGSGFVFRWSFMLLSLPTAATTVPAESFVSRPTTFCSTVFLTTPSYLILQVSDGG